MGRTPCCEKVGLKKGPWTPEEDKKLLAYIEQHGHGSWRALPSKAGLQRCGKSCRLRWTNYLRPDIKRGKFSLEEEQTIIQLHALLGNRWSAIATHLPKRTDNEIKNYWNTHIKKRLTKMGIDPVTHRRRISALGVDPAKNAANLSHMAQWENARLEAEARLVREAAKLVSIPNQLVQDQKGNSSAQLVCRSSSHVRRPQPLCLDVLKAWQGIMRSNLLINGGTTLDYSPTSTMNFSDNMTTVGFVDNQCISMVNYVSGAHDQGMIMEQNIQNDSKIFLESNIVPQIMTKEINKMENVAIELLHEMAYPPNNVFPIIMEGFTNLVDQNTNTHDNDVAENYSTVDIEENWSSILSSLANFSSLGSPVF